MAATTKRVSAGQKRVSAGQHNGAVTRFMITGRDRAALEKVTVPTVLNADSG